MKWYALTLTLKVCVVALAIVALVIVEWARVASSGQATISCGRSTNEAFLKKLYTAALFVVLACSRAPSAPKVGTVEGDVYLAMQSGDVKRLADNEVSLVSLGKPARDSITLVCAAFLVREVPLRDSVRRWSSLVDSTPIEPNFGQYMAVSHRYGAIREREINLMLATKAKVDSLLRTGTSVGTRTNVSGHYRFDSVPPGKYDLASVADVGTKRYQWFAPIEVTSGKTARGDLNNSAIDHTIHCGM